MYLEVAVFLNKIQLFWIAALLEELCQLQKVLLSNKIITSKISEGNCFAANLCCEAEEHMQGFVF